jgi:hypothetical protein
MIERKVAPTPQRRLAAYLIRKMLDEKGSLREARLLEVLVLVTLRDTTTNIDLDPRNTTRSTGDEFLSSRYQETRIDGR